MADGGLERVVSGGRVEGRVDGNGEWALFGDL